MLRLIYLFLFISFSTFSKSEIVNSIKVNGNNRISVETVKVYGEIKLGSDYSNTDLNSILKKLYSTNFFDNVELSLNNGILEITVKEYSVINEVILEGEKSNTIKKLILERLQLKSKNSFIPNKLNEDINLLKKIYASMGYNFVSIDTKLENFSNNRLNLKYIINRGDKTYIKKISFIGDKKIRESRLRDIIVSEEKKFWKFLSNNTYFNEANINLDKRLLTNYFKSLGYYDIQILSNNAEIDKNSINLIYTINAGTRYKVSKISTNLDKVINKEIFEPLRNDYEEIIGKNYSPFKVTKLLEQVDELIANNELQFIEHSVNEIISGEEIEIKINIFEGKKELVERINIIGNTVTEESTIRSELLIDEGDPLSNIKFEKSIAELKARNIFGEIKTKILDGSSANQKIIEIEVEEKPTGEISAGAGIGTTGGSFAFKISENNWLGKGINLSTSLDVSSETFTGELSVTDPNYNFSGNSLTYYVSNTKNDKGESGYKNNIFSLGIGTGFEQYRDVILNPNISFSYDDLKVEDTASASLKRQKGTFTDVLFDYGISLDKRDRVFSPTDGHLFNFRQAIPIYADAPFIKNSMSFSSYKSFTPSLVGAAKFYVAAINGLNDEDVRLSKRLALGSRLRGFEAGKLGPKDGNDYIGGNYAAATNLEMNLPNLLPESMKTDVGLFLDFGNVWHVDYNKSIDDSNKLRSTVGINTSWLSPIGPMSFIFSQNISKASSDVIETFNFRLGTTF
jgi:outer membrane protein insertion porin family